MKKLLTNRYFLMALAAVAVFVIYKLAKSETPNIVNKTVAAIGGTAVAAAATTEPGANAVKPAAIAAGEAPAGATA